MKRTLQVELLAIDLCSCKRCVPTGEQLKKALELLSPVAEVLDIELDYREIVVGNPEEAKRHGLLSSPTIRLNGRDIDQNFRESECESCGELTENNTRVDCREWTYRGKTYSAAPLPLLVEAIMKAMLDGGNPAVAPGPVDELSENLLRFFDNRKGGCCCS